MLLFLLTGSVVVPLKAMVMNLLSLTATFGVLVWGFQDGHLSGLLGFESTGYLGLWLPFLVFFIAFGLSMDYEVFLLARMKEIHDQTGDNDLAVTLGLQRTGRIITSAAVLIGVVFAAFATGETVEIKALGDRPRRRDPARRDDRADPVRPGDDEADGRVELVGAGAVAPTPRAHRVPRAAVGRRRSRRARARRVTVAPVVSDTCLTPRSGEVEGGADAGDEDA